MEELRQLWKKPAHWYAVGRDYWLKQEASVEGVLGGFGRLNETDAKGSQMFLDQIKKKGFINTGSLHALDCGAGIGRVTKEFLIRNFQVVDLVEPADNLLNQARIELESLTHYDHTGEICKVRNFFLAPLQNFVPEHTYDVIWAQWVLLYLTDSDLIEFFKRCKQALRPGGVICFKENVIMSESSCIVDNEDCSVTRRVDEYRALANEAGLKVIVQMRQSLWPSEVYPVVMFACVPA